MTETSLKKLEQLIEAAPLPSEPDAKEDAFQTQGDDPTTLLPNLTTEELVASQIVRGHELANQITIDEIDRQRNLDKIRDRFIPLIFLIKVFWLVFVAICVISVGFKWLILNDTVLIAMLTTTTATVLGIFVIVAKWLFPSK